MVQPIPLGVTFSNAASKLKAQSSNVSLHRNVAKERIVADQSAIIPSLGGYDIKSFEPSKNQK